MENMELFEQFNNAFDIDGLHTDIEQAASSNGDYVEVPLGDYEVAVTKLELGASKKGLPQAKVWFKIVAGDFKGQMIFMNQNLTNGFQFKIFNDFLESLDTGISVVFDDYVQYAGLLHSVFKEIDGHYEYHLSYGENDKGYKTYYILEKFNKA